MSDVVEDDGRGVRPAGLFAVAAITVISGAVLYNALLGQTGRGVQGPTTHMAVDAGSTRTVRLKYDPVIKEVQRQLLATGHYKGPLDGVSGTRTREAIESYQRATGVEVTGEATPGLAEHIRYTRELAEATLFTGSVEADAGADQRAKVRRVQASLAEIGYTPGAINGEMSEATRNAIKAFERDKGLPETGVISQELLAALTKTETDSN